MVQRLESALLRLHQVSTLPPYGALAPISAAQQGRFSSARTLWDRQGKPGGEGNADFERAILEYLNVAEVSGLIEERTQHAEVANWRWRDKTDQFAREKYLVGRDILYDSNYLGQEGGASIDPEA